MKTLVILAFIGLTFAAPIEDTDEVKAAKADFNAAFEQAEKGEHASLAPQPVATAYLDDAVDVANAKAVFNAQFNAVQATQQLVAIAPYTIPQVVIPQPALTIAQPTYTYTSSNLYPYYYGGYYPTLSNVYSLPSYTSYVPLQPVAVAQPVVKADEPAAEGDSPSTEESSEEVTTAAPAS